MLKISKIYGLNKKDSKKRRVITILEKLQII